MRESLSSINESTAASGTGLLARYYDHADAVYDHAANFGDAAGYAFTRGTPTTTGTILVTLASGNCSALQSGQVVRLSFNGGNLNSPLYNHLSYLVTARTATTFTVSITTVAALPTNSSSSCNYSIQSFPHHGPIDTYSQREIVGLPHVFSGWDYAYDGAYRTSFSAAADWTRPMREVPARHDTGPKRVLNNKVLSGLASVGGQPLDANATHPNSVINDPAYQALPGQEFTAVHDMLSNHPNTGSFICRQLIQRMVTSHPSRDYVYRVVQAFNDNGSGVRGDMQAVLKAILLDYEARSGAPMVNPAYGRQREPILRVSSAARAFRPASVAGTYLQSGSPTITISTSTSTPHLLRPGNSVFLEFTDTTANPARPAPTTGTYNVFTVPNSTSYTIAFPLRGQRLE